MRIIAKGTDNNFHRLVTKVRGRGYKVPVQNDKRHYLSFDLPKVDSEFIYELLEQDAIIERDVRADLD